MLTEEAVSIFSNNRYLCHEQSFTSEILYFSTKNVEICDETCCQLIDLKH